MKRFIVIAIILSMIMLLGCGVAFNADRGSLARKNIDVEDERIKTVYRSLYERIFFDTETNVMYLYEGLGYGGGMTVMLDKDGKPLLWEKDGDEK